VDAKYSWCIKNLQLLTDKSPYLKTVQDTVMVTT